MKPPLKSNPYSVLGVDVTAGADEIKRAYRDLARKNHPDKGGSHEMMADLNQAFECLSDPIRRAHFDATGRDDFGTPTEVEARGLVLQAFSDGLQNNAGNCLHNARQCIILGVENIKKEKKKIEGLIARLEKKSGQVRLKKSKTKTKTRTKTATHDNNDKDSSEMNLFQMLIDQQLAGMRGELKKLDHGLAVSKMALGILEGYESSEIEVIQDFKISFAGFRSNSATDW